MHLFIEVAPNALPRSAKCFPVLDFTYKIRAYLLHRQGMATSSEPMCVHSVDERKTSNVTIKEGDQAILKKGKTVRIFQIRKKRYVNT